MANYMENVAKLLGLKLKENFEINDFSDGVFWIDELGLQGTCEKYDMSVIFEGLICGRFTIKEEPWKAKGSDVFFTPYFISDKEYGEHRVDQVSENTSKEYYDCGFMCKTKEQAIELRRLLIKTAQDFQDFHKFIK